MLSVSVVLSSHPGDLVQLEESLARLSKDMTEAALGLHARGKGALDAHWTDAVGELAGAELAKLAASFEIVGVQLRAACSVLSGVGTTLIRCQREVSDWVTACAEKGCVWREDGGVIPADTDQSSVVGWARSAQRALRACLAQATAADETAAGVLMDWRLTSLDGNQNGVLDLGNDLDLHLDETLPLGVQGALDGLRAGVPTNGSVQEQRRWWRGLTEDERQQYLKALPLELAGMNGLPDGVRTQLRGDLGYDRIDMLRFVDEYWNDESIDWADTDPHDEQEINNCTNFVSRSLEAGGLKHKGFLPWSDDSWTHVPWAHVARHPGAYSDSWGGADQQHDLFTAALTDCGAAATSNAGLVMANALAACQQGWADELSDLVRRTMIAADKLDDSALLTRQAEEQNTRAVNALLGLL